MTSATEFETVAPLCNYPLRDTSPTANKDIQRWVERMVTLLQPAIQAAREAGVEVREVYWTFGGHDGVLVLEAPDDRSVSTLLLSLSRAGMVRTHTLRAYDRAEMKEILGRSK